LEIGRGSTRSHSVENCFGRFCWTVVKLHDNDDDDDDDDDDE
jgi:hypothetical protein